MYRIFSYFLFLLFSGLLFGQQGDFRLVETRSYDNNETGQPYFFPPPDTEGENLPSIFIHGERLSWQNVSESKSLMPSSSYTELVFSQNGNYFAVVSFRKDSQEIKSNRDFTMTVYNKNLEVQYELSWTVYYDEPSRYIRLSDRDGAAVLGEHTLGKIWIYDTRGELVREMAMFPGLEHNYERPFDIAIDPNGENVIVLCAKRASSPDIKGEPHLFLLDKEGKEIWTYQLPYDYANNLLISGKGNFIAVGMHIFHADGKFERQTLVFNHTGDVIAQSPLLYKQGYFSENERFLLLAEKHKVELLSLKAGKTLWRHTQPIRGEEMVTDVYVAEDGKTALLSLGSSMRDEKGFKFINPKIHVLDEGGRIFQEIDCGEYDVKAPQIYLSPDKQQIVAGFSNAYQIFQVK